VENAVTTENKIVELQGKLKEIREGDYSTTPETGTVSADAFKLRCTPRTAASASAGTQG
jgi:hypothetical protein